MSVVVKGMKMPDSCAVCRFAGKGGYHMERVVCMFTGKNEDAKNVDRLPNCPLVALPDKHGDLIARDGVLQSLIAWSVSGEVKSIEDIMDEQDTIVEAEDSE